MSIYELAENMIKNHKEEIQLIQASIINGVASLVYSEYISNITQKQYPIKHIYVPTVLSVRKLLSRHEPLIEKMKTDFFKEFLNNPLIDKSLPELSIVYKEAFPILMYAYIFKNVSSSIPDAIAYKFKLNDMPNAEIREDKDKQIFPNGITESQFKFIVEQSVLYFIANCNSIKKEILYPESNKSISITKNDILMIENDQALTPIYITSNLIENYPIEMDLVNFVTSSSAELTDYNAAPKTRDNYIEAVVTTNMDNKTTIITLG